MIPLTLLDVAEAVSGITSPTVDTSAVVAGKCEIDSRLVQPGDLFIAIKGENHDGHDHVEAAIAAGAVAAIVSADGPGPRIVVTDTVAALAGSRDRPAVAGPSRPGRPPRRQGCPRPTPVVNGCDGVASGVIQQRTRPATHRPTGR